MAKNTAIELVFQTEYTAKRGEKQLSADSCKLPAYLVTAGAVPKRAGAGDYPRLFICAGG